MKGRLMIDDLVKLKNEYYLINLTVNLFLIFQLKLIEFQLQMFRMLVLNDIFSYTHL